MLESTTPKGPEVSSKTPDHNLLIISDLHLSEGRHPIKKKFSPNEDFFFDEEFARFLAYYSNRWPDRQWCLIINGDFLDFLQVTSIEGADESLSRDSDRPEYGLGCGAPETIFKLDIIMDGHWQFFHALAKFIVNGNYVTIIKGNHDVEFHYEDVRNAFKDKMYNLCQKIKQIKKIAVTDRISFSGWFYYEPDLLWVEHGNQYDEQNCFRNWLAPLLPANNLIDLPFGSLFVRYLFNRVERKEPFADNIKPQSKFISWFLFNHPIQALGFFLRDGCYMLKKLHRAWKSGPDSAYKKRDEEHRKRRDGLANLCKIDPNQLKSVDELKATSVLR